MLRLATFKYIFVGGFFLPFKVYCKSNIIIRKSASVSLLSRITFGNPSKKSASISTIAANLYLGYNSITKFGKSISVGPGVNIIVKDNGALSIGDGTYFTSDLHIEVIKSVEIGNNCALSWG
ncbi:MAG TPA: hypothetical protein PLS50_07450, partial [Candidatus Dojkabacteria bacterium]|nr:hypothetical protein [Candidatus Dojkabacteria bacterium]